MEISDSKADRSNPEIYKKLRLEKQEIRLLTVHPGKFEDELVCYITAARLWKSRIFQDRIPRYETISYAWGDASERALLRLNGYQVDVPASSAAAIRRMRLVSRPRVLWIDAICINQLDLDEKLDQVANMGKVYSSATGNLVYLGEDRIGNAATEIAVLQALVDRINDAAESLSDEDREKFERGGLVNCWRYTDLVSDSDVEKLSNLFSAPWFTRLWVVQEATLARANTCHWGKEIFALNDVTMVADAWSNSTTKLENNSDLRDIAKSLLAASSLRSMSKAHLAGNLALNRSLPWFSMYSLSSKLLVSDPRDHVYALLGLKQLGNDGKQSSLTRPDYRKSVGQVYRDATRCSLESEGDFILGDIYHRDEAEMMPVDRPSWTVRWGRHSGPRPQYGYLGGLRDNFMVHGCENSDVLRLRGYLLESVTWNTGRIWLKEGKEVAEARRSAKDVLVAANECPDEISIRWLLSTVYVCGLDFLRENNHTLEHALSTDENTFQDLMELDLRSNRGRNVFITKDRRIGSGPGMTRNGDRLFIAQGGYFVHILRPAGDYFLYVGVAYVTGLMDGEVLDKGIEPRIIDIR